MRWKIDFRPDKGETWRPWFAWFPVVLSDTGETAWLETVWRRIRVHGGGFGDHFTEKTYCGSILP